MKLIIKSINILNIVGQMKQSLVFFLYCVHFIMFILFSDSVEFGEKLVETALKNFGRIGRS